MEDEERAPLRAANLRTPGRCLVLTASSFGVSWTATVVFYAVVVFHLDVGMHQTLQRTIWTSGGVLLFCLAAAIWSGRSLWKHMAGKPGKGTAAGASDHAGRPGVPSAVAVIALCLAVGIVSSILAMRMMHLG